MNKGHGSPYDRGTADSYYSRPPQPHKWLDDIGRHREDNLTEAEKVEYWIGYSDNEESGAKKDWGE